MRDKNFLVVFNGNRDQYQVPLALAENRSLSTLVTDFYLPDAIRRMDCAARFRHRYAEELSSRFVTLSFRALLQRSIRAKTGSIDPWFGVDKALGLKANELLKRTDTIPIAYSHYAHWAFQGIEDRPRVLFQFHPHQAYCYELLRADFEANPEVAWSFHGEIDSLDPSLLSIERRDEWKLATDAIVASSFTAKSLIRAGFSPSRISVVPYGSPTGVNFIQRSRNSKCKYLFVGQGVQRKGLHHLLKAWKKLSLSDAELTLVCTRIDPGIRNLCEAQGITLLPRQEAEQLDALMSACDVFVMPSLIEGFGLVYTEALSYGCYVIGTPNSGLPDLELTSESVALVEPGSTESLMEGILRTHRRWKTNAIDRELISNSSATRAWARFRSDVRETLHLMTGSESFGEDAAR